MQRIVFSQRLFTTTRLLCVERATTTTTFTPSITRLPIRHQTIATEQRRKMSEIKKVSTANACPRTSSSVALDTSMLRVNTNNAVQLRDPTYVLHSLRSNFQAPLHPTSPNHTILISPKPSSPALASSSQARSPRTQRAT